jgi:hypothetical protein
MFDSRGLAVSTRSADALQAYERAIDHLNGLSAGALANDAERLTRDPSLFFPPPPPPTRMRRSRAIPTSSSDTCSRRRWW